MSEQPDNFNQRASLGSQGDAPAPQITDEISFEQALTQLQEVVQRLNQPELSLDEALKIYERGVKLARHGRALLSQAERQFESLRTNLGDGDEPSA